MVAFKASRAVYLLALLAFFFVGSFGHSVAMTGPTVEEPKVVVTAMTEHHIDHRSRYSDDHYGGQACCAMGQCMLGVSETVTQSFPPAVRFSPAFLMVAIRPENLSDLPYRPPAFA
jgi:hypothetical protein